jgi:hypothetical protein
MVKGFEWDEWNGAGKTQSHMPSAPNVNWGNVDQNKLDYTLEANKIPRGENSFDKYIGGHFTGNGQVGPNGKVWHSTQNLPADVKLKGYVVIVYATPAKTSIGAQDMPIVEGSALVVQFGATPETATNDSYSANPTYSAYIHTQMQTLVTAAVGVFGPNTLTLKYDES